MRRISSLVTRILLVGLIAFGASTFAPRLTPNIPVAHATTVSVVLTGCIAGGPCINVGWNGTTSKPNPPITVTQGDTVSLSLTSQDGLPHQFLLETDGEQGTDTADCPTVDPCSITFSTSGPPTPYSFTASMTPGTYMYYCTVHPTFMFATFTIMPSSTVGGTSHPADKVGLVMLYAGPATIAALAIAGTLFYIRRRNPSLES